MLSLRLMRRFATSCLQAAHPATRSKTSSLCKRSLSFLHSPLRPTTASAPFRSTHGTPLTLCQSATSPQPSAGESLDLLPKISSHPALASLQIRNGPRNTTNNMTHRVRKRRFGFLARKRTRGGRAILKRRRQKGRKNLSH